MGCYQQESSGLDLGQLNFVVQNVTCRTSNTEAPTMDAAFNTEAALLDCADGDG